MQINMKNNLLSKIFAVTVFLLLIGFAAGNGWAADAKHPGQFYLVSVGVGDPDLITVRAIETIQKSDIIICRPDTRQAFSKYMQGKIFWEGAFREWRTYRKDCTAIEDKDLRAACQHNQDVRDALAARIRKAVKEGKIVSVLGSGDLLIYGGPFRWYMEDLKNLDIKIIPGVSCLNAANAALGRDIMDGGETHSTVMTTYREIDKMAAAHPTMVIFTMHTKFPDLVEKLKAHYPVETPIAIVFYAGYKQKEYIVSGTLMDILEKTSKMEFPFEHLVYVGNFLK